MAKTEMLERPHAVEAQAHTSHEAPTFDFPREEWEALRSQDRHAAMIIACLLGGVFTAGLAIYTYIWWVVAQ